MAPDQSDMTPEDIRKQNVLKVALAMQAGQATDSGRDLVSRPSMAVLGPDPRNMNGAQRAAFAQANNLRKTPTDGELIVADAVMSANPQSVSQSRKTQPMTWVDVGKGMFQNSGESTVNLLKDMAMPFIHPIDTLYNIGELEAGVLGKMGVNIGDPDGVKKAEGAVDAVGQFYKDRYGSLEGFKHALATDPAGVVSDVVGVATLGGGLAAKATGTIGKIARAAKLADLADGANTISKIGDLKIMSGAKPKIRALENRAKTEIGIYDPIPEPQRSFAADYPNGAEYDSTGRLAKDIEGRPLITERISGRKWQNEPDEGLIPSEVSSLGSEITGRPYEKFTRGNIPGIHNQEPIGLTELDEHGLAKRILIADGLNPADADRVLGHEVSHGVNVLAGGEIDPITEFRPGIPTHGLKDELERIYNIGATGEKQLNASKLPENIGYDDAVIPHEYMAEAIRYYLADPNAMKTIAPKTAARIRQYVNSNPKLNRHIQLNNLIGAGAAFPLAYSAYQALSGPGKNK